MLKQTIAILLAGCILVPGAFACQNALTDAWASVSSRSAGDTLKVKQKDGSEVKGTLKSAGDTGLVLVRKNKELSVSREEIASVSVVGKKSVAGATVIGLLVGGGAGAGAGAGIGAGHGPTFGATRGQTTALGAAIVGGIGAAVGSAVGFAIGKSGHKETVIYQASPAK